MLFGTVLVVAFATAGPEHPRAGSYLAFPPWQSGPLHFVFRWLPIDQNALKDLLTFVVLMMLGAWGIALKGVRTLSMRVIVATIVALHVVVLLSPPLQLNDVFNYLGYARLGAVHHLSPYTHVIRDELHDPVFRFSSWHNLSSPYGPLFTAVSYPLALLPLPVAYWIIKLATMGASLGLIALLYRCARQLGRDPRYALVFMALNPIYIVYAMGGFHNDFFMLLAMLAAISFMLSRHDRRAGAVLMFAVAIKFTAVLLLPFLLLGVRQRRRQRDIVIGSVLAAVPLALMSLALFGPHLPNLSDQSTLLTPFSITNLFGLLIGADGGAPWVLKLATVALVVCVAWLLYRRARLVGLGGLGDGGADRQPGLADALVCDLGAAAGRPGHEPAPAPRRGRADRVPDRHLRAAGRQRLLRSWPQSAQHQGRARVQRPAEASRALSAGLSSFYYGRVLASPPDAPCRDRDRR